MKDRQSQISLEHIRLLGLLEGNRFCSGVKLAESMCVSRTSISNWIAVLAKEGLDIERVTGKGYRLSSPIAMLDESRLKRDLNGNGSVFDKILIDSVVTSTNDRAGEQLSMGYRRVLCLAESQQAGRGRRGRQWVSLPGFSFCGTIGWTFDVGMAALEGLSLAIGVALAEALSVIGLPQVELKWPNDLVLEGKKLGGVLIEMSGDINGPCKALIGIGINVYLPERVRQSINQPVADIYSTLGMMPDRHELACAVVREVTNVLNEFSNLGFRAWRERWQARDALLGRSVMVSGLSSPVYGIECGVTANGALIIQSDVGLVEVHGGEVSLRGLP